MPSASTNSTGGLVGLRDSDLLSAVTPHHWLEAHLFLYPHHYSSASSPSSSTAATTLGRFRGRSSSRIWNWIVHDKDKDRHGQQDHSDSVGFRFTLANVPGETSEDAEDGDIVLVGIATGGEDDDIEISRNEGRTRTGCDNLHSNSTPNLLDDQNQNRANMTLHTPSLNSAELEAEEAAVDMLTALMGEGFDRAVVRRILRKYDGNMEKAAGALVEGERGEETDMPMIGPSLPGGFPQGTSVGSDPISMQSQGWPAVVGPSASSWSLGGSGPGMALTQMQTQTGPSQPSALGGRPNTPVIDLTLDDDPDLQRAMQESMNTLHAQVGGNYAPSYAPAQTQREGQVSNTMMLTQQQVEGPVFGPSERPPDPNWAMVPSHQNDSNDANYFQNLNRAIEASLETMGDSDALEPFPVEQQLRRDGCPVVLRPSMHTMVYAASILQGLFYVPQVRARMACWRPPIPENEDDVTPPMNGPDYTMWALSEIFTHMDLARLCDLNVDKRLPAFNIEPWDRPTQPPGELSRKFFARLVVTLERAFMDQLARHGQPLPKPRLLHFQYGSGVSEPGEFLQETSIVPIDVNGGESNDLIGRLSAQLSKPLSEPGKQSVIFEPSEVVAFELVRSSAIPSTGASGGGSDRRAFAYPNSIYLDQFLRENVELAREKRRQRQDMLEEVQRLVLHKKTLTHFDGKDTLEDLRSAIFYYEHVADAKGDLERGTLVQGTTRKLKDILATIEEGIKAADEKIEALRTQAEALLDCEELQQYKYDLRVVLVHDGLYGRKHLYSYVHDKSCWWKIADALIEKVPEELVLNDQTGLHLGAGPYLLFYSRALENESPSLSLPWMDDIKDDVRLANREFLSQLPPELVGGIVIDEEISSSNAVTSSSLAKNGGANERMDMSL